MSNINIKMIYCRVCGTVKAIKLKKWKDGKEFTCMGCGGREFNSIFPFKHIIGEE